jgi:hypothetical protein
LIALKAGSFSCGGSERSGLTASVPVGIRVGDEAVEVEGGGEGDVVVDAVEEEGVDVSDVSAVRPASGSDEREQPATRSTAATAADRAAFNAGRRLAVFDWGGSFGAFAMR